MFQLPGVLFKNQHLEPNNIYGKPRAISQWYNNGYVSFISGHLSKFAPILQSQQTGETDDLQLVSIYNVHLSHVPINPECYVFIERAR